MRESSANANSSPGARAGYDPDSKWAVWKSVVDATAQGRWYEIIPAISPRLRLAVELDGDGCPCPNPKHHGSTDGFRVFSDFGETGGGICNSCGAFPNGYRLLSFAEGWEYKKALSQVAAYLKMPWDPNKTYERPDPRLLQGSASTPPVDKAKAEYNLKLLVKCWSEAAEINWQQDNVVTRYLRNRGLAAIFDDPPQDLRLHPGMEYRERILLLNADGSSKKDGRGRPIKQTKVLGTFPVMLAAVRTVEGDIVTLHRTYLNPDGRKAHYVNDDGREVEVPKPKKAMSAPIPKMQMGGAIRLFPGSRHIGVSEGIETALAARLLYQMKHGEKVAVWATGDAEKMRALSLPDYVEECDLFADNDEPARNGRHDANGRGTGEHAAEDMRAAHPDRTVRIWLPKVVDEDWLDVYKAQIYRREAPKPIETASQPAPKTGFELNHKTADQNLQDQPAPWVGSRSSPLQPKPPAPLQKKKTHGLSPSGTGSAGLAAIAAEPSVKNSFVSIGCPDGEGTSAPGETTIDLVLAAANPGDQVVSGNSKFIVQGKKHGKPHLKWAGHTDAPAPR